MTILKNDQGESIAFEMTNEEFFRLSENYNGLCSICGTIEKSHVGAWEKNRYCSNCGHRKVYGMDFLFWNKAIQIKSKPKE